MRTFLAVAIVVLIVSSPSFAQKEQVSPTATAKGPLNAGPKLSKEQYQRVTQLLDQAEAGAATLDSASRIVAYADLARTYAPSNKAKAIDLLDNALTACRTLDSDASENDRSVRAISLLQERVLRDFGSIAPDRLDARVSELSPEMRERIADLLVAYYLEHKAIDRARDLVLRIDQESEMPYRPATTLMSNLKNRPEEVRSLFITSLSSFESHGSEHLFRHDDGFPEMIVAFYQQLPEQIVMRAINSALAQAQLQRSGMSISGANGSVSFGSIYDYRLFQLIPVLKKFDPIKAEALLQDKQEVRNQLDRYPDGTYSVIYADNHVQSASRPASIENPEPPSDDPEILELRRFEKAFSDAKTRPQDSLANAALLSPGFAMQVYQAVTLTNVSRNSAAARKALSMAEDLVDRLPLDEQLTNIQSIAFWYLKLHETDGAKRAIEKGMKIAGKVYDKEKNEDNPNTAPKACWLSTSSWRSLLASAEKINDSWAQELIGQIPDDSIRVFNQISMADVILGLPDATYVVISDPKKGNASSVSFVGN
jgi:hypothetical protein